MICIQKSAHVTNELLSQFLQAKYTYVTSYVNYVISSRSVFHSPNLVLSESVQLDSFDLSLHNFFGSFFPFIFSVFSFWNVRQLDVQLPGLIPEAAYLFPHTFYLIVYE